MPITHALVQRFLALDFTRRESMARELGLLDDTESLSPNLQSAKAVLSRADTLGKAGILRVALDAAGVN